MNPDNPVSLPARRQQVKDRALSRFGMEVGKLMRQTLIQRVGCGDVKYARKVTNSRTVIVLEHAGNEMAFIYSNVTKEIVSFLGPDAPETADWRCSQSMALALFRGPPLKPGGKTGREMLVRACDGLRPKSTAKVQRRRAKKD